MAIYDCNADLKIAQFAHNTLFMTGHISVSLTFGHIVSIYMAHKIPIGHDNWQVVNNYKQRNDPTKLIKLIQHSNQTCIVYIRPKNINNN